MITADFHTHTSFSTDSKASPESMIERAIALGLKTYCITDHMDYFFPEHNDEGFTEFVFDPDQYFETLTALKKKYRGKLDLRIGIELGLRDEPDARDENKKLCDKLVNNYPFDFVIGSTHVIDHFDPYNRECWGGRSAEDIVQMYYDSVLYSVRNYDCFNVYGHLDYIIRYIPEGVTVDLTKFDPIIDTILKELIARGKGITIEELLDEIEAIVYSGTKLNIDYYIRSVMDDDHMQDIYDYFLDESETDDLDEAMDELGDDYTELEIRLVRIKFLSEMAN